MNTVTAFDGQRVYAYELDPHTRLYGTLRQGETIRGPEDWYVDYDDGESCLVLDFSALWDARTGLPLNNEK